MFNRHEIILFLKLYEAFMQDVYIRLGRKTGCIYCLFILFGYYC